ncbi:DUF3160 domain-containing protein [Lentimonas sp. CC8]|uniref:DUF3160 domain-containing protein n=1 Tax=Lentimonas sp. CC8 TaxID=2676101 RepID=UPI0038B2AB75
MKQSPGSKRFISQSDQLEADAPRVAGIVKSQELDAIFHVGIGHPRILYVLYPHKGRIHSCIGAVMPYYEFIEPSVRLTDDEWLERLKKNPPSVPESALPIYVSDVETNTQ